jgi:maltose/maltodextrin transport system substrate-binding protein
MKRFVSLGIAIIMALLTLAPVFAARNKITIWCTDKEVSGLEPLKKQFKKKKKVKVEIEIQAEPRSKYIQAAIAGTGPDILVGAHDWVGELAKNGVISEINLTDKERKRFWPVSINGFTYNGKLYGVPYCVEAMILIYNKKLIKTPPKTWEDLIKVAKPMTNEKENKYGFLYGIDNNFYNNFPFIGSQGGYIFKFDEGKGSYDITDVGLDTPGAIDGAKFILRLVNEGIVPTSANNGTVESAFLDGKVAMIMDGPWNTKNYAANLDIGVAKLPTLKGKPTVPFVGARGFMMNTASKMSNYAKEFIINYAGEEDGQAKMFEEGGRPPAHIEACKKIMKENNVVKTVVLSANDGIPMPNVKAMAVIWNYAAGMVDAFKTGETSVENAIRGATKSIRDELTSNKKRYQ